MGGCTTAGPECAETKEAGKDVPGKGIGTAGPVAAKTGAAQGAKIRNWPRAITWDDFREVDERPAGVKEDAEIHSEAIFPKDAQIVKEKGRFRLGPLSAEVVIVPENTWVVKTMKQDPLLSHEQGHYDITGLAGRDTLRALAEIRAPTVDVLAERVQKATARVQKLANELTERYDDETSHGLNATQQKRWKDHIRKCMKDGRKLSAPP
jgi:hypothetical protein